MHRQPLAHRSTRSTRSSISNTTTTTTNNNDYNPLLASSVLSPAAQVAVARGRSLPTAARPAGLHRPTPSTAVAAALLGAPSLPPPLLQHKSRVYPPLVSLTLGECVPDAHPDDVNDPYLVAAYACLRAHNNKAMTLDAISAWCHRNRLLSQGSEPHLRDHLRTHLSRHPDRRNALFTWYPLTANDTHLKDALHNPALVLTPRITHVWYISKAGRAQCPFARLGFILNSSNLSFPIPPNHPNHPNHPNPKRKSPPFGAASLTADATRSTKMRITLRLPPKSLFPSRPRARPCPSSSLLSSSQAPSHHSDPHTRYQSRHDDDHDGDDNDNQDDDADDDDDDEDDEDDDESGSDTDDSSDDDLLYHSIISPVGPISIPTFRPAHDPLSIHVLCPFALDSDPPPDSEDEADDFHNSMLRQDIQSDFRPSPLTIKHEFIPLALPSIIDVNVNVKQELDTPLPTDIALHEWDYNSVVPLLPMAAVTTAASPAAAAAAIKAEESHIPHSWSLLGSEREREQSIASTTAFPLPVSPPSTSSSTSTSTEHTMSPSPTLPSECDDTAAIKTEDDCVSEQLSMPTPAEDEVFAIEIINPLDPSTPASPLPLPVDAHPPRWEDGPICGPESVSPDDVDLFWGGGARKRPAPAESSKMAAERAMRTGRTRLHLRTGQHALRRPLNTTNSTTSGPAARVDRMCSMSSVASDWTADDDECALLTPAHTGWKMSSNWKPWPLERQTTAIKLPENKVKAELPIKVEPKEDELAIAASDKLKRLITNSTFSANLHKANCPTIQTRVLLGLPVFQCLILYPQVTLLRRMDTDWVNVTTLMQYCSYVTSKAQDGRLPPPPVRADLPAQAVFVESSSPLIHGAWAPLGVARSVARAHDTVPWIKRTFLGDTLADKFPASTVTEAKACLAHEVPASAGFGAPFARPSVLSADELKPPRVPLGMRTHSLGTVPLTPLDLLPKAELFASFNNPPSTPVSKPTLLSRSMVTHVSINGEATFPHCVQIKGEHLGPDPIAEPLKPEEEELLRAILVTSPAKKEVENDDEMGDEQDEQDEAKVKDREGEHEERDSDISDQEDAMDVDEEEGEEQEEQEEEEEEEDAEESAPARSTRSKTRAALPAPTTRSRRAVSPASTCSSLTDSEPVPTPVPVRKVGRPSKATIAERKAAKEKEKAGKGAESDEESTHPRRSGRMQARAAAAAVAKAEAKKKSTQTRTARFQHAPRRSLPIVPLPTKSVSSRSLRAIARSRA